MATDRSACSNSVGLRNDTCPTSSSNLAIWRSSQAPKDKNCNWDDIISHAEASCCRKLLPYLSCAQRATQKVTGTNLFVANANSTTSRLNLGKSLLHNKNNKYIFPSVCHSPFPLVVSVSTNRNKLSLDITPCLRLKSFSKLTCIPYAPSGSRQAFNDIIKYITDHTNHHDAVWQQHRPCRQAPRCLKPQCVRIPVCVCVHKKCLIS